VSGRKKLRHVSGTDISSEVVGKGTESLTQNSWSADRDSNPAFTEYEADMPLIRLWFNCKMKIREMNGSSIKKRFFFCLLKKVNLIRYCPLLKGGYVVA
jgi:hypothetical protein